MIGMEFSPLITVLEGDFNMDNNASSTETDTLDDDTKLMSSKGKPEIEVKFCNNEPYTIVGKILEIRTLNKSIPC